MDTSMAESVDEVKVIMNDIVDAAIVETKMDFAPDVQSTVPMARSESSLTSLNGYESSLELDHAESEHRVQKNCCPLCLKLFKSSNIRRSIREHMQKHHQKAFKRVDEEDKELMSWTVYKTYKIEELQRIQELSREPIRPIVQSPSLTTKKKNPSASKRTLLPNRPKKVERPKKAKRDLCAELDTSLSFGAEVDDMEDGSPRKKRKRSSVNYKLFDESSDEEMQAQVIHDVVKHDMHTPTQQNITEVDGQPASKINQSPKTIIIDDVLSPAPTPQSKSMTKAKFVVLKRPNAQRREISTRKPLYVTDHPSTGKVQTGTCLILKLEDRGQFECAACTSRSWKSGGCRFSGLRKFISGSEYVLQSQAEAQKSLDIFEPTFSINGTLSDSKHLLNCLKPSALSLLQRELKHERSRHILRKQREENTRATCDGCATTIFCGHWMCYICGREICLDCYEEWNDEDLQNFGHINACKSRRGEPARAHAKVHLVPYTMFPEGYLSALVSKIGDPDLLQVNAPSSRQHPDVSEGLPYAVDHIRNLDEEGFKRHWATGEPLLLDGFQDRFQLSWDPDYFITHHGDEPATLVDVIRRETGESTIAQFFSALRQDDANAMQNLKLGDWPDVADFAIAMPRLFSDFEAALPFPKYTRRKGFMNLASWFPPQFLPPDLGPKLYCAGASSDADGAQGTTVLHMDMTDAVNIMTWSGPAPINRRGSAVWDIFPMSDSNHLRKYLLSKTSGKVIMDDPIRRAQFYLHAGDLKALETEYGVRPWRIYQSPGEAVFIPAGCAHQVCNLTPCIKVACDFVSPENVERCSTITTADRRLATLAKREDVLQLKNLIYFAYSGLLHWLEKNHPDTCENVVTQDNEQLREIQRMNQLRNELTHIIETFGEGQVRKALDSLC